MGLNRFRRRSAIAAILSIFCLLGACSTPKTEEALRKRVARYWDARVAGDLKGIYDFYIAEEKGAIPFDKFMEARSQKVRQKVISYEIQSVKVEGDRGEASVRFVWRLELPVRTDQQPKDQSNTWLQRWQYENGDWYFSEMPKPQP